MASYDVFARFYDEVQGDRAFHAEYLRGLIEQHHKNAKTVLELACGTGSVLKQLEPDYEVTGLDLSETMLAVAARKVPGAQLVRQDMTQLDLGRTFDVVLCVFDSINHLLTFEEWKAVFRRAHEHLNDRGIFVFDINTEGQLAAFIAQQPWTHWFGDGNLVVMDVTDAGDGIALWTIRVFERVGDSAYRLHTEDVPETSFPADRVKATLLEHFRRVSVYDAGRSRPSARSGRLHFVCRK
jgi:SAM-dependent methyltransferase